MVRIITGIIIGILLLIFMIQNTAPVEITFFAWTINMSRAILVLVFLVFGIFIGVVLTEVAFIRKNMKTRRKEKQKQEKEEQKHEEKQQKGGKKEKQMEDKNRKPEE
jgi:uncharacterized integral membrane protein